MLNTREKLLLVIFTKSSFTIFSFCLMVTIERLMISLLLIQGCLLYKSNGSSTFRGSGRIFKYEACIQLQFRWNSITSVAHQS